MERGNKALYSYTVYEHKYCKTKKNIKYEDDINDPKWVLEYSEKWYQHECTKNQTTQGHKQQTHI